MVRSPARRPDALALVVLVAILAAISAACGGSAASSPDPQTASARDGRFEVVFTVDRTTLTREDAISGTAELWLRAGGSGALSGSSDLFGFEFVEVGGENRAVTPVLPADCSPHQVGLDRPLTSPIVKTGGTTGGSQDAFVREFLQGREIRLPAGEWDITAIAGFFEGRSCSGLPHTIRATVRVKVSG